MPVSDESCTRLTARVRWCRAAVLPGRDVCRFHATEPEWETPADFAVADARLADEEIARGMRVG